ncbi:hypothetical protein RJ639_025774 [Escallonia herrerae]|uniref:BZIP domain-containing protein n=1 Tax=Escallonia herrerae TaxID=1293975 RepID=A0AA89ADA2_9ASTE|nr:hypothetical protein RJ639_025774 [Escallonia herrerae]
MIYQDFLARPFSSLNDAPPAPPTSVVPTAAYGGYPSLEAPPVTVLSLNSGPDEVNILAGGNSGPSFQPGSNVSARCFHVPFQDVLLGNRKNSSSSSLPDLNDGKRTFPAASVYNTTSKSSGGGGGGGDRRHKRMIKNRNILKRAYTNELELEVAHLIEENTRLKKQQQQNAFLSIYLHQGLMFVSINVNWGSYIKQQLLNFPESTLSTEPQPLHFEKSSDEERGSLDWRGHCGLVRCFDGQKEA